MNDAVSFAYEVHGLTLLLCIQADSNGSFASSQPLSKGVSLEDICVAAHLDWDYPFLSVCVYVYWLIKWQSLCRMLLWYGFPIELATDIVQTYDINNSSSLDVG